MVVKLIFDQIWFLSATEIFGFKDPDDHGQIGSARKILIFIFEIEKNVILLNKRWYWKIFVKKNSIFINHYYFRAGPI